MNRGAAVALLLAVALLSVAGCASSRSGVTGLSRAQHDYYAALGKTLKANRQTLDSGLTLQLAADRTRERHILEWERDLQKADVILEQRSDTVKGRQRLLELKLSEIDLAAVDRVNALLTIDEARKATILRLYDKIIEAVGAVEKNNTTILAYLENSDAKFLVRSLDLDGIFRVTGAVQQLQGELNETSKQAQEEKRKQTEEVREAVQRARNLLIKVYSK
jgi:hypothetical protein